MVFDELVDRDITVHTRGHKYRGVLAAVLSTGENGASAPTVLGFKMGVDDFYILESEVIAVTVHGREFGTEVKFERE